MKRVKYSFAIYEVVKFFILQPHRVVLRGYCLFLHVGSVGLGAIQYAGGQIPQV